MKWTDIYDIARLLEENYPGVDVSFIRFTELKKMVMSLKGFKDLENGCNEKVLEAIQAAWLEEKE